MNPTYSTHTGLFHDFCRGAAPPAHHRRLFGPLFYFNPIQAGKGRGVLFIPFVNEFQRVFSSKKAGRESNSSSHHHFCVFNSCWKVCKVKRPTTKPNQPIWQIGFDNHDDDDDEEDEMVMPTDQQRRPSSFVVKLITFYTTTSSFCVHSTF